MVTREDILRAAELIRAGKLVAFPTETVYGLGANALDPDAVARIFAAKGRPSTSPLIVHAASVEMVRQIVSDWPDAAAVLGEHFWPGPLTLLLRKRSHIPDSVTAGLPTVGIRVPSHPVALELIRAAGVPIAAPSANAFTHLSPTTAEHVRAGLGDRVDVVLDGGPCSVGIESTVLSLAAGGPILLRPGMVSRAEIEALIGPVASAGLATHGAHASPGLHARHYSPRTPLRIGFPDGLGAAWVFWQEERPAGHAVRMPSEPRLYAARLYDVLHQLDQEGWDSIYVEPLPEEPQWSAIRDRLKRASCEPGG